MSEFRKTKRRMECELTEPERDSFGRELANLREEYADLEALASRMAKGYREDLEVKWERMGTISGLLRSGKEDRDVDCIIVPDHSTMSVIYKRADTGDVVFERAMTEDERQGRFTFESGEEGEAGVTLSAGLDCRSCTVRMIDDITVKSEDLECPECKLGPLCEACYEKPCDQHAPFVPPPAEASNGEVAYP